MTVDAAAQRTAKARLIALHLWRHGLTVEELRCLPYSSRTGPSMTRFAREAFRAAATEWEQRLNPPHSVDSATWQIAARYLVERVEYEASGGDRRDRDLVGFAHLWQPDVIDATPPVRGVDEEPAHTSPQGEPPPVQPTSDPAEARAELARIDPGLLPPGWAQLAALDPLSHGQCIHHPHRRPVTVTPDGGRCAACPPMPREFRTVRPSLREGSDGRRTVTEKDLAVRDGWGCRKPSRPGGPQSLNWAPTRHNPGVRVCGCGRCPTP